MRRLSPLALLFLIGTVGCGTLRTADSGIGITASDKILAGIGSWGLGSGVPQVVVHQYNYQAQPQPTPPGAPPSQPTSAPPAVAPYQTVYGPATYDPQADPTRVILWNESSRATRLSVDGQAEFRLEPYQATVDLALAPGKHIVRLVVEKPTRSFGTLELAREFPIYIRPEGRSQTIQLPVYDW